MDLIKSAVAMKTEQTLQKAEIAVMKVSNEMEKELIDMVSEAVDSAKIDGKGQNVDTKV